ncbi:MAG: AI-2E family transporter [Bacteroidia bacterium]|nr:AI-2E family transporter [Bacteroidia bacterium]
MDSAELKFPRYAKLAFVLLSLCMIVTILYYGQHILIPLILSLLFAILLRPVVILLNVKLRFPNVIAVFVTVVFFVLSIATILLFVSWQVADITDDWNKIKINLSIHFENVQQWIKQRFHVSYRKQENYIQQVTQETLKGNSDLMGNTLSSFTDTLVSLVLIPIYTFLILLYRSHFTKFLYKIVSPKNELVLQDILTKVKTVVQSYIVGLIIEMGIVGVLTTTGLMLLGVEYAIFLGLITAILNLIPYLGILVAAFISILATLVNSNEISMIIGIIILNMAVQLIDNNIIVPKIVGNKVRINALATMVGVIIGGAVSGVAGMILSIPLIAILKVIFDHIEPLKPLGFLMGNDISDNLKSALIKKNKK